MIPRYSVYTNTSTRYIYELGKSLKRKSPATITCFISRNFAVSLQIGTVVSIQSYPVQVQSSPTPFRISKQPPFRSSQPEKRWNHIQSNQSTKEHNNSAVDILLHFTFYIYLILFGRTLLQRVTLPISSTLHTTYTHYNTFLPIYLSSILTPVTHHQRSRQHSDKSICQANQNSRKLENYQHPPQTTKGPKKQYPLPTTLPIEVRFW